MSAEASFIRRLQEASVVKPSAPTERTATEVEMERTDADFRTPVTLRNLFTHHDAHPVVLDLAMVKAFGPDWLSWEAETVWAEVGRLFKTQLSEHTRAKLNALRAVHSSPAVWESWHVFEKVVQALNNNLPTWQHVQALALEQLWAGVDILTELRHETFSDECRGYIAACILHEEVVYAPPPLDFVQAEVSRPFYRCRDCGNTESALFHDGVCDVCARKFDGENYLTLRALPEAEGRGKNTELVLKHDPTVVERRYREFDGIRSDGLELDPESPVDIQVHKLLLARDYANIRRRQLAEQLVALKSWLGA